MPALGPVRRCYRGGQRTGVRRCAIRSYWRPDPSSRRDTRTMDETRVPIGIRRLRTRALTQSPQQVPLPLFRAITPAPSKPWEAGPALADFPEVGGRQDAVPEEFAPSASGPTVLLGAHSRREDTRPQAAGNTPLLQMRTRGKTRFAA